MYEMPAVVGQEENGAEHSRVQTFNQTRERVQHVAQWSALSYLA
jgi:hypothetical protein